MLTPAQCCLSEHMQRLVHYLTDDKKTLKMRGEQGIRQKTEEKLAELPMLIQMRIPGQRDRVFVTSAGSRQPFREYHWKKVTHPHSQVNTSCRPLEHSAQTPKNDRKISADSSTSRDPFVSCTYRLDALPRHVKHVRWGDEVGGQLKDCD